MKTERSEAAPAYRSATACYVQAWECTKVDGFNGYVYSQRVMLDKLGQGCDVQSLTIVRHEDGSREYLPGTIAAEVFLYRTSQHTV